MLYICISIPVLQISLSVPFFWIPYIWVNTVDDEYAGGWGWGAGGGGEDGVPEPPVGVPADPTGQPRLHHRLRPQEKKKKKEYAKIFKILGFRNKLLRPEYLWDLGDYLPIHSDLHFPP